MKTAVMIIMTAMTMAQPSLAQNDTSSIEQTLHQFVKAAAERDVHGMHYLLHEHFQSFDEAGARSKSDLMKLLGDRKSGGVGQTAEILHVDIAENSASVRVRLSGREEMNESFIHLLRSDPGAWQIVHILPCHPPKL